MKLISAKGFEFFSYNDFLYFIVKDEQNIDKYYKSDLSIFIEISQEEYSKLKFGNCKETFSSPFTECSLLPNGEYVSCLFHDSIIYRHKSNGDKIKALSIGQFGNGFDTIYSLAVDKDGRIWIAQPTSHYIGQFDLDTETELFRIGGDHENPDVLNHPEQIRAIKDAIYVCDMGNHRVCKIDNTTYNLTEYLKFNEPVWEYGHYKDFEIVRLKSGIYHL